MRIIPSANFTRQPWKNGGGVTHEIEKREAEGSLLWRLSIADVERDGPFSSFPGLHRILTVISGAGLVLAAPDTTLNAATLVPVSFSGETAIDGRLVSGAIRDFNVIFDPVRIVAAVDMVRGRQELPLLSAPGLRGLLAVDGSVSLNGIRVEQGSFAFFLGGSVTPEADATALTVSLQAK